MLLLRLEKVTNLMYSILIGRYEKMFKSVFTKYMTSFALLIAMSFMLLVFTVSTMLTSYSINSKSAIMNKAVESVAISVQTYRTIENKSTLTEALNEHTAEILTELGGYASLSDSEIYIVACDGTLIATSDDRYTAGSMFMNESVVSQAAADSTKYALSNIEGTFGENRLNSIRSVVSDNNVEGIIIVSSTSAQDKTLYSAMIKTILLASAWILLAALVIVYIISQRIIDPLRKISQAAKSFARGNFSERVYVSGHDEVAELAEAFNNMAGVLEKNEENRNSFLGNVSHDLRTPMTVISGFVDGIRDGTIPPEKHDYYLEIISTEVRRLSRLVNTLLEISRMQSGERKLNISHFNVSEKARQVLLSFEKKIDDKKLNIEFNNDEDVSVSADTDLIHQVLYNLMDNAVKFTPVNGTIAVSIETKDKKAWIRIRNTGEGIPPDELPNIFERFYKSDRSRGLDKTGTGLGLYIAKTNVNMHGEQIICRSKQNEFTEFEFSLPL